MLACFCGLWFKWHSSVQRLCPATLVGLTPLGPSLVPARLLQREEGAAPSPAASGGGRESASHTDEECFAGRPRSCCLGIFVVGAWFCGVSAWGWEVPGPAGKESVSQPGVPCGAIPLAGASSIVFSGVLFFSFNLAKFLFSCTLQITKVSHWIWVLTWAV